MKTFPRYIPTFILFASSACFAQVDIYQSDAYSVEEMCARQAEQDTTQGYAESYDACIEQNRDNPMYREEDAETNEGGNEYESEEA